MNTEFEGKVMLITGAAQGIGERVALVGESGSGKSVSMGAVMGLIKDDNVEITGEVLFQGEDLLKKSDPELRAVRGKDIAMIFQDPMSALHPYYSIGDQLIEAHQVHNEVDKQVSRDRAIELLTLVGVANPDERMAAYPHQFSGGMRQRVMIALAIATVLWPARPAS